MFRLYLKTLSTYKRMSAVLHVLYVHGHEYLTWAKDVVGVPLGAISEGAIEAFNKVVKKLRRAHARMSSLEKQSEDIHHWAMWPSDPKVIGYLELIQKKRRGFIRRSARSRAM